MFLYCIYTHVHLTKAGTLITIFMGLRFGRMSHLLGYMSDSLMTLVWLLSLLRQFHFKGRGWWHPECWHVFCYSAMSSPTGSCPGSLGCVWRKWFLWGDWLEKSDSHPAPLSVSWLSWWWFRHTHSAITILWPHQNNGTYPLSSGLTELSQKTLLS